MREWARLNRDGDDETAGGGRLSGLTGRAARLQSEARGVSTTKPVFRTRPTASLCRENAWADLLLMTIRTRHHRNHARQSLLPLLLLPLLPLLLLPLLPLLPRVPQPETVRCCTRYMGELHSPRTLASPRSVPEAGLLTLLSPQVPPSASKCPLDGCAGSQQPLPSSIQDVLYGRLPSGGRTKEEFDTLRVLDRCGCSEAVVLDIQKRRGDLGARLGQCRMGGNKSTKLQKLRTGRCLGF
jgi:hypothetical protein